MTEDPYKKIAMLEKKLDHIVNGLRKTGMKVNGDKLTPLSLIASMLNGNGFKNLLILILLFSQFPQVGEFVVQIVMAIFN